MLLNQQDFHNSLASLNLSPVMCMGFEEDAYGAIYGLLNFRSLNIDARHAWDVAISRAALANAGSTGGFHSPQQVFYSMLRQTRAVAFGNGLDDKSINNSDSLVACPWCLTDKEFEYCYVYVNDSKAVKIEQFDRSFLSDDQKTYAGLAFSGGQILLGKMLSKYAPEMFAAVETTVTRLTVVTFVASVLYTLIQLALEKKTAQEMKRIYAIDARRREYLKSVGQGTYRGLVAP
ncbi:hypothetical protein [Azospirillum sp. B4]|uniref:hypothetical protein n=1 Tax=Azospirillum sp. B4 TaxID=95605 RepID=UPI00034AAC73|nr:hypothetical protein [Azospirillum sp. B4]